MLRRAAWLWGTRLPASLGLLASLSCSNAGETLGFGLPGVNKVSAFVYVDRDRSGTPNPVDTVFAGASVALIVAGTQDTVAVATSDAGGRVDFTGVSAGSYSVTIGTSTLGDSLLLGGLKPDSVVITARGTPQFFEIRLVYVETTIAAARALPAGKRVMVTGLILAEPGIFGDTTAHIRDSTGAIRLTRAFPIGFPFLQPGDSVRVLGTTATRGGQPTLDQAGLIIFNTSPAPGGDTLTSGLARTADGQTRDADLVTVVNAPIIDTASVGADFVLHVDDGSGALEVLLDGDLTFDTPAVIPGLQADLIGVLVPQGAGVWRIQPRNQSDITVH